jgi:Xaa-Pro aminopeptidase
MAKFCADLINKTKADMNTAIENTISVSQFKDLQKHTKSRIKAVSSCIDKLRAVKDAHELKSVKKAVSVAAKALEQTISQITYKINESALAGLLDYNIRLLGATNSFDTIVAFGANASCAHHQPGTRKLHKTDSILIDFGARYQGYCSDITRCFTVGKPSTLFKRAFNLVDQAKNAAISLIRDNVKIKNIDRAAHKIIDESDLPAFKHGTGHGIGLKIHENPFVNSNNSNRLHTGQIITIEQGIYIPGKLGIRLEDDILVTDNGCQILTRECPHNYQLTI